MHGGIKAREDAKLILLKMKSTERKVQLNVRINEKLLNEIKYGAKIRGLRVNEYCESLLKNTNFDESSYRDNFESRISRLENYVDNHIEINASQNLSKKYCKDFGNLLSNYFISIAREKLLSREELWEELSTKKCLKHVPEEKVTLFQDILRGEHIYSPSELTDSITYGDGEYPFTLIALEKLNKEINLNLRRAFKKCFLN